MVVTNYTNVLFLHEMETCRETIPRSLTFAGPIRSTNSIVPYNDRSRPNLFVRISSKVSNIAKKLRNKLKIKDFKERLIDVFIYTSPIVVVLVVAVVALLLLV